jgi:hypothetical protein
MTRIKTEGAGSSLPDVGDRVSVPLGHDEKNALGPTGDKCSSNEGVFVFLGGPQDANKTPYVYCAKPGCIAMFSYPAVK